jgi:carboxypeptidase C (cathepsin A)
VVDGTWLGEMEWMSKMCAVVHRQKVDGEEAGDADKHKHLLLFFESGHMCFRTILPFI